MHNTFETEVFVTTFAEEGNVLTMCLPIFSLDYSKKSHKNVNEILHKRFERKNRKKRVCCESKFDNPCIFPILLHFTFVIHF